MVDPLIVYLHSMADLVAETDEREINASVIECNKGGLDVCTDRRLERLQGRGPGSWWWLLVRIRPAVREVEVEVDPVALLGETLSHKQSFREAVLATNWVDPNSTNQVSKMKRKGFTLPLSESSVPKSDGVHASITKNILCWSCDVATSSVLVSCISNLKHMQR